MATPDSVLSTQRPDIADSMLEFDLEMNQQGFIGSSVLPVFESGVSAGKFGKIPIEELLQTPDTRRAPGAGYARGRYTFTPDSFETEEHGAEEPVDDRESKIFGGYFNHEVVAASRARNFVMQSYEIRVAALLQNNATFTNAGSTAAWTTTNTATPIADVLGRQIAIYNATGLWPNAVQMTHEQFLRLKQVDEFIDKVKDTRPVLPGDIGISDVASAFEVPFVLVSGSTKNTANPGQTASLSSIWDRTKICIGVIATNPNDFRQPSVGRTFHYGEDGSVMGAAMESYRDETVRADIIRARMDTDEKLLYTELWQILTGVLA